MIYYDAEELRYAICDRYTAEEIVELLDISSEEIYDILKTKIEKNMDCFELINLDTGYFYTDYEDEKETKKTYEE